MAIWLWKVKLGLMLLSFCFFVFDDEMTIIKWSWIFFPLNFCTAEYDDSCCGSKLILIRERLIS